MVGDRSGDCAGEEHSVFQLHSVEHVPFDCFESSNAIAAKAHGIVDTLIH